MDGLQRLYRTSTRWAVAVSIPPIVVCFVAPSVVLHIWPAGSDLAIPALRIACISQLFCTAVGSVNYLLMMAGFPRQPLFNGLPALALNLGLSFALMPRIGVTGAAVANAVSMMTANGLGLWQVWRALKIHPFDAAFVRPFVAAGPAAAAVWLVARIPGPPVVIAACAGVAAAVAFALAMRALGLDEDDRAVVLAIRRRVGR
jgi:O-antigen/teichoic acid export membrane protein